MNIQKVNNQPQFGARMPLAGNPKQINGIFNAILAVRPEARYATTKNGKLAYIVNKEDISRLPQVTQELSADEFQKVAGNAGPLSAKDVQKAIDGKRFDFDGLSMPR